MTLVYALVSPAPARVGVRGVVGEPLRLVTVGRVTAVLGDVARAPKPTEANLRAYSRVIHALARATPAVLPARFATAFRDAGELALVLQSRQSSLRQVLRHVRNRTQMTIRVIAPETPVRPADQRVTGTGSAYLKALADDAARARQIVGFEPVRAAVRRWLRDERVERQGEVASVYHLIPRGSVAAYRAALDRAVSAAGLRVRVSGPWPPYAFTTSV